MAHLKRQKLLCWDRNITNTTLQYAALDISAQSLYVRSYLCFFYLNRVIFSVLDVPSLPYNNVKLLRKFFSQCSTLVRNTVVRAIHTVNERVGNSTPRGSKTPWLRHPPYPTCTIWLMSHNGFRGTVGVKLSHRRAFLCIRNIFVVPPHSVQHTLKTLAWRSMHPKVCFGGKLIPRG